MVLEEALHQFGISLNQLNVRFMLGTTQAIKAMVAQGLGVSVLSARTILRAERDVFHVLKIRETALMRTFSLVHPKTLESPLARTLVRIILTTPTSPL
jgi:DNA-binding transcriptional LysR family regulator